MPSSQNKSPKSTDERLPRCDDSERYLLSAVLFWPDRAPEIVPLVKPVEFFDQLHQDIWRAFTTQLATTGDIDPLVVGRKLDCVMYFHERIADASTSVHAAFEATRVREAHRARMVYDTLQRAANAVLAGRGADTVLAHLELKLADLRQGAAA